MCVVNVMFKMKRAFRSNEVEGSFKKGETRVIYA